MKKVNAAFLERNAIDNISLENVVGGSCGCACRYANSGGSSSSGNSSANGAGGKHSPGMKHFQWRINEDGTWSPCDYWM